MRKYLEGLLILSPICFSLAGGLTVFDLTNKVNIKTVEFPLSQFLTILYSLWFVVGCFAIMLTLYCMQTGMAWFYKKQLDESETDVKECVDRFSHYSNILTAKDEKIKQLENYILTRNL